MHILPYFCTMFIHNTTYVVPNNDARDFVVWVHQVLLPRAAAADCGMGGKLMRILSHKEEDTECFSVQLEAPSSAHLHRWHIGPGRIMADELHKLFDGRIVGFGTLMEEITAD